VNAGYISEQVIKRYADDRSYPVASDRKYIENMGYRVIEDDIVIVESGVIRHDPAKLAKIILGAIEEV